MSGIQVANLTEAKNRLARLKQNLARVKEETQRATKLGVASMATAAGGAAAGALAVKMPTMPGLGMPSDFVLGTVCVGLAMLDAGGDYNDELASFGSGMLAVAASREVAKALK
jgi:hypothetical protein